MKKIIAVLAASGLLATSIPQQSVTAAETPALTDIVSLQKWILGESESTPTDGQTWDWNADGTVNIADLCQMKRQYTTIPVQNPMVVPFFLQSYFLNCLRFDTRTRI